MDKLAVELAKCRVDRTMGEGWFMMHKHEMGGYIRQAELDLVFLRTHDFKQVKLAHIPFFPIVSAFQTQLYETNPGGLWTEVKECQT